MPNSAAWLDAALSALESARILRVADQSIELAHDALASRISEARSADRLEMLNVERLVRDGIFHQRQDHAAYLSSKDLTIINRAQKRSKAGVATLDLNSEEIEFVNDSRKRSRWRKRRIIASATVAIFGVLCAVVWFLYGVYAEYAYDDDLISDVSTNDRIYYDAYRQLAADPHYGHLRRTLLEDGADQSASIDWTASDDGGFWHRLGNTDLKVDAGKLAASPGAYGPLEQESQTLLTDAPSDLRLRVRMTAVLRREAALAATPVARAALMRRILQVTALSEQADNDTNVDFSDDINSACASLKKLQQHDPHCDDSPTTGS
jgi:hypothetical protein